MNKNCDDNLLQIYYKTRQTVLQVEVFMAAAAVLLFFQLVCGSLRRRTNNSFIQGGLWVAHTFLPPLVTYTLGVMQSSQVAVVLMYPVWALSLFLISGGSNSVTAYDLDDNRLWRRGLFDILQYDIYFCIVLFQLLYPSTTGGGGGGPDEEERLEPAMSTFLSSLRHELWHPTTVPVFILFTAVCFAHAFRTVASWMVNYSYPSKVVADYMKEHVAAAAAASSSHQDQDQDQDQEICFDPDATTMEGCNYLVNWSAYQVTSACDDGRRSSLYRCEPLPRDGIVTVAMVWNEHNQEQFTSHGLISSRIKGACLSYSLSHLLRRRFFGMDCAEAGLPETRRFVLQGLLSDANSSDEYTEAFRVIEMELAFLYDFFYTRYALIFGMEGPFFSMAITKIICSFGLGVVILNASFSQIKDRHYTIFDQYFILINPSATGVSITAAIIGTFLTVEVVQFIMYLRSDWAMVSLACSCITGTSNGFIPFALRRRFEFLFSRRRVPLFGYWQDKLGQDSIIEGSKFFRLRKDFAFETSTLATFIFSRAIAYLGSLFSRKGLHFVKLPDKLKREIVSMLKSSRLTLTNGKASFQRNGVLQQFSWTLQNETQTETMLIWHIATEYCRISSPWCDSGSPPVVSSSSSTTTTTSRQTSIYDSREVATKLSCYCAYLMSNAPKLLPGNSIDTKFVFDELMYKAREALGTTTRDRDGLRRALACAGVEDSSILAKGLKLGTELERMQDGALRWKVMAEFWTETILYIAPSDNTKAHMELLARGGEFLTHLWALLTHAGVLNREQEPKPSGLKDNSSA